MPDSRITELQPLSTSNVEDLLAIVDDPSGIPDTFNVTLETLFATPGGITVIAVENEATDTTSFPLFVTAPTGDLGPKTNPGFTFNALTSDLSATLIAGIANANLLDKSATETVSGAYTFSQVTEFDGNINLNNGQSLNIKDATETSFAAFLHDGTDFNLAFVGTTTDWNITSATNYKFDNSIFITEKVSANTDVASLGQFWVRADNPNTPMFTDDNGNDFELNDTVSTAITVANEATDTTCFPLFVTAATGELGPKSNTGLTFDSATADLATTGAFNCAAFTSTGIDDNATGERLQISDTQLQLGTIGESYTIIKRDNSSKLSIFGGSSITGGSGIIFHGNGDTGEEYDISLIGFGLPALHYDHSESLWDAQDNDVITTGAFIGSASDTIITGTTHTLVAADNGKNLVFTNAAAIAVTLPDFLDETFHCTLIQTTAAGIPTVTPSGSDTLNGVGTGLAPADQWKAMYINKWDTGVWFGLV